MSAFLDQYWQLIALGLLLAFGIGFAWRPRGASPRRSPTS
jgi:hypothetical protein